MSKGLNRAQIIGYVGQAPDLNHTSGGTAVCNLRVATNESYTDNDGNRVKKAEWHTVVCWEGLAEIVAEHLEKGSRVYVEGPMQTREFTDRDGVDRQRTQIKATDVTFLDSRSGSGYNGRSGQQQKQPAGQSTGEQQAEFVPDDELPFS